MARKKKKARRQKPKPTSNLNRMPRPRPISLRSGRQQLETARQLPLLGCWIDRGWQEQQGLARLVVAREQENGRVIFGTYLVDYFCLGVKDAFWRADVSKRTFHKRLPDLLDEPQSCVPALAHGLIYGAVDYAEKYGFHPHHDFKDAEKILEPRDKYPPSKDIEFGKDGKPFYISGPYDDPDAIIARLLRTAGTGNFNYLTLLNPEDEDLLFD